MLVLEDVREGAVLVLELLLLLLLLLRLLSWRRNWKLANLERGCDRVDEMAGRGTGRGAWSTGVAPLLGRKQLKGITVDGVRACSELQRKRRSSYESGCRMVINKLNQGSLGNVVML